jgi:hypothetical protein
MANVNSFTPSVSGTKTVSATATNTSQALNTIDANNSALRVANAGPNTVYVTWGIGAQTASVTTSVPVMSGTVEIFCKGFADTVAAICASTQTATVYFSVGEGQ